MKAIIYGIIYGIWYLLVIAITMKYLKPFGFWIYFLVTFPLLALGYYIIIKIYRRWMKS